MWRQRGCNSESWVYTDWQTKGRYFPPNVSLNSSHWLKDFPPRKIWPIHADEPSLLLHRKRLPTSSGKGSPALGADSVDTVVEKGRPVGVSATVHYVFFKVRFGVRLDQRLMASKWMPIRQNVSNVWHAVRQFSSYVKSFNFWPKVLTFDPTVALQQSCAWLQLCSRLVIRRCLWGAGDYDSRCSL